MHRRDNILSLSGGNWVWSVVHNWTDATYVLLYILEIRRPFSNSQHTHTHIIMSHSKL